MVFEIHHLEAFDPTGRMFSRNVRIDVGENGYIGHFGYEGFTVQTGEYPTIEEVLKDLTLKLQRKGFTEIRTRVNFREERYLAEREPWVYHKAS
ncbi:MAG: hypothetical protein WAO55_15740 [Candidatus Manganitrophaceae bacterium]